MIWNKECPYNGLREIIFYKTKEGKVKVEILMQDENIWLTQAKMAELFEVNRTVITKHLSNIFKDGELEKEAVCAKMPHTAFDGKSYKTLFYNLEAIIAVGYRVNSKKATMFRIWASSLLKDYVTKGFVIDEVRLKNPRYIFGQHYFDEQLERIDEIRGSEREAYQKITDIYALCSADYEEESEETKEFYAAIHNKMHYELVPEMAEEVLKYSAIADKENWGLTSWRNEFNEDENQGVSIVKHYSLKEEYEVMDRIVTMYLDYAEMQTRKQNIMYMSDWIIHINKILKIN